MGKFIASHFVVVLFPFTNLERSKPRLAFVFAA